MLEAAGANGDVDLIPGISSPAEGMVAGAKGDRGAAPGAVVAGANGETEGAGELDAAGANGGGLDEDGANGGGDPPGLVVAAPNGEGCPEGANGEAPGAGGWFAGRKGACDSGWEPTSNGVGSLKGRGRSAARSLSDLTGSAPRSSLAELEVFASSGKSFLKEKDMPRRSC